MSFCICITHRSCCLFCIVRPKIARSACRRPDTKSREVQSHVDAMLGWTVELWTKDTSHRSFRVLGHWEGMNWW